jgi:hypothetical protein
MIKGKGQKEEVTYTIDSFQKNLSSHRLYAKNNGRYRPKSQGRRFAG